MALLRTRETLPVLSSSSVIGSAGEPVGESLAAALITTTSDAVEEERPEAPAPALAALVPHPLQEALSLTDAGAIDALVASTPRELRESEALLRIVLAQPGMAPVPQAPLYLEALLRQLPLSPTIIYEDIIGTTLMVIRDRLLKVVDIPVCERTNRAAEVAELQQGLVAASAMPTSLLALDALAELPYEALQLTTVTGTSTRPLELWAGSASLRPYDHYTDVTGELAVFFDNARQFLDLVLMASVERDGLGDLLEEDANRYTSYLLDVLLRSPYSRVRVFALELLSRLLAAGLDPYAGALFHTVHQLLQQGSCKTLADIEDPGVDLEANFDRLTELLTMLIAVSFDLNYQHMTPLTFDGRFGRVPGTSDEAAALARLPATAVEENAELTALVAGGMVPLLPVQYEGLTIIALATIYNRADALSWLLQFCGPLPLAELEEEEIAPRTLDIDVSALDVTAAPPRNRRDDWLTLSFRMYEDPATAPVQCDTSVIQDPFELDAYTPRELARRHRSHECAELLAQYAELLARDFVEVDPLRHDLRMIEY